ncbi:MAG: queuosine precursor transporter [Phycisphaerales bacterium]
MTQRDEARPRGNDGKREDWSRGEGSLDPVHPPYAMSVQQRLYVWLAGLSVACLLLADVLGVKLFRIPLGFSVSLPFSDAPIDAIVHTCGMLTFPITFLLTDLLNEYYGKRAARRVTWISLSMAAFAFVIINITLAMPHLDAPYNVPKSAFDTIFGSARIMYVASLTAYVVGQLLDIWVFHLLKRVTSGKLLWLRATGSTIFSQIIDSFIVTYLAFGLGRQLFGAGGPPPMTFVEVLKTGATGYMLKFVLAIGVTPLIYAGHALLHRVFGLTPLSAKDARA